MTRQEVTLHSISISCAVLIAFIGLIHEVVGHILFPWAPIFFGPFLWHFIGIILIILGVILIAAISGRISFPVVWVSRIIAVGGVAAFALVAFMHQQFHFFATCLVIASLVLSISHSKSTKLQAMR